MQQSTPKAAKTRPSQARRIALVSVIIVATVVLGVVVRQHFVTPTAPVPGPERDPQAHVGTVRLWPDPSGLCPQFRFDNDSGVMTPNGVVPCTDPPPSPGASGGMPDRIDSIREGFRRR
ncbi:hypothetical protein A33M_3795 [Rhodovulum sp. PH10]|uniref:hypothetical protein n=1 Tax=Rhodovulum sp. PH10 TaxID=1187851 RepID=UPI00027C2470|nr:hypothetical protein [Rhodovulum sp. PH10]EJW13375.1 hypothetical protein A33M_3795 [Rhodovulum sp. PH10]